MVQVGHESSTQIARLAHVMDTHRTSQGIGAARPRTYCRMALWTFGPECHFTRARMEKKPLKKAHDISANSSRRTKGGSLLLCGHEETKVNPGHLPRPSQK